MKIDIDKARKRESGLRGKLEKLAKKSPGRVPGFVRLYLKDRDCRIVAALDAWEKSPTNKRPSISSVVKIALETNLWEPCDEPVYASFIDKDGPNAGHRPILIFGIQNRIRQTLVRNCMRAYTQLRDCQYDRCGGRDVALDVVEQAYRDGYRFIVQSDVENCYRNICGNNLHKYLKLPEEVTNNVIIGRKHNILPSYKICMILGDLEGTATMEECFDWADLRAFREGIPQGSTVSPLCATAIFADVIDKMPEGVVVVNYADDFLIMRKDAKDAVDARFRLRAAIESHPAGTLRPGNKIDYLFEPGNPFSFLGYDIHPNGDELVFRPGRKIRGKNERRLSKVRRLVAGKTKLDNRVKREVVKTTRSIKKSIGSCRRYARSEADQKRFISIVKRWCNEADFDLPI